MVIFVLIIYTSIKKILILIMVRVVRQLQPVEVGPVEAY
jgi:hypothetical protein